VPVARPTTGPADLVTLAFHKVGEPGPGGWPSWFYVPEAVFLDQLRTIQELGCTVVDADTFLRQVRDGAALPERSVLLTFDDGYRSMLTVALPHLRQAGYPAVLFVPTAYIGGTNEFDHGVEPREEICGWDELRELTRRGVSIQSHGVTHTRFSELTRPERVIELSRSRAELEKGLGTSVELMAYPYGDGGADADEAAELLRATGYEAAFYYGDRVSSSRDDPFRQPRVAMGPDTDLRTLLSRMFVL
jgi:peptidoglycan/xylan/chitin deacetylase (PgdA/CDA1 family)